MKPFDIKIDLFSWLKLLLADHFLFRHRSQTSFSLLSLTKRLQIKRMNFWTKIIIIAYIRLAIYFLNM